MAVVGAVAAAVVPVPAGPAHGQAGEGDGGARVGRTVILRAGTRDAHTFVPPPRSAVRGEGPLSTFSISYNAAFPSAARTAFERAADIWASLLASPVAIRVRAEYVSLGPGVLAGAGPGDYRINFEGAPLADTWYPIALAEALAGANLNGTGNDITVSFNVRNDWYFGTDGQTPSGRFDFLSVALHELGHGLGFIGSMAVSGSTGSWGAGTGQPDAFDTFLQDGQGRALLDTSVYPNPSANLGAALRSADVHFSSPRTNRSAAGRPTLYAPPQWESGSSIYHTDEDTYPPGSAQSLMTPVLDPAEAEHGPGPMTLCMLAAMGWSTAGACDPPAATEAAGFTWYSDGTISRGGPGPVTVTAYATGAARSTTHQLVTGLDGGIHHPCMYDVAPLNPAARFSNNRGFIGNTTGTVARLPGRWQVCFLEVGSGATLLVTGAVTVTVQE
jgi:hypothetical protein